VTKLEGSKHRPGVYQCNECREQFTVTVKTVFERSKIPLTKWLAALFLLTASKCSLIVFNFSGMGPRPKQPVVICPRCRRRMATKEYTPMEPKARKAIKFTDSLLFNLHRLTSQSKCQYICHAKCHLRNQVF
jgi:hypothetical protein